MLDALLILASCVAVWLVLRSFIRQLFIRETEQRPDGLVQKARLWLVENDYDVLSDDAEATYTSYIDDASIRYEERAQLIARKHGHEYAVFVGVHRPTDEDIHKRFFPLYVILGVRGIIFLDLSTETVHHVDFEVSKSRRYRARQWFRRGCWFMGGAMAVFAWVHRM